MKSVPIRGTVTTGTLTLYGDGCLHVLFSGRFKDLIIDELTQRGISPNCALEITVDKVNSSKTVKQNSTFHLLWGIYWKSGLASDVSKTVMRNRLKYEYGVTEYFEAKDGTVIATLKSVSDYTLTEGRQLISGTIEEMLVIGVNDQRFQDMVKDWNEYKKEWK